MTVKDHRKKREHELLQEKLLIEVLKPSYNSLSKITKILAKKINPTEASVYGNNAIHHAAKLGKRRVLELLIDAGGDILRTNESNQTALMIAARGTKSNHSQCVECLLKVNGCNVNAVDNEGRTALRQAILAGNAKSVELLLNYGCNLSWEELRIRCSKELPHQPMALKMAMKLNEKNKTIMRFVPQQVKHFFNPYEKIVFMLHSRIKDEDDSSVLPEVSNDSVMIREE